MSKIVYSFDPVLRDAAMNESENKISARLVELIDVLFALVIVEGALFYRPLLAAHGHRNAPAVIALALIIYTVVRSFVDWHTSMEFTPYQIITSKKCKPIQRMGSTLEVRTLELWRLYVDFLIVASYSVLLLRAHVLLDEPGAGLRFLFWGFPAVFLLYLLWGRLLGRACGGRQFNKGLLFRVFLAATLLAIAYNVTYDEGWLAGHGTTRNVIALLLEALIMIVYRFYNWQQQRTIKDARPAPGGPS
jgi:hypothetical protein